MHPSRWSGEAITHFGDLAELTPFRTRSPSTSRAPQVGTAPQVPKSMHIRTPHRAHCKPPTPRRKPRKQAKHQATAMGRNSASRFAHMWLNATCREGWGWLWLHARPPWPRRVSSRQRPIRAMRGLPARAAIRLVAPHQLVNHLVQSQRVGCRDQGQQRSRAQRPESDRADIAVKSVAR